MNKAKKLFFYTLLLFAFFPIIPNKIKGLPVIMLFFIAVFLFFSKKKYSFNFKKVLFYSSLYLLYLLSLLFTTNFNGVDKTLTTRLSILAFPLIFGLSNTSIKTITQKQIRIFLSTYFLVSIIYCGLIVVYFYQVWFFSNIENINLFYAHLTYEMWGINQHPIYASIFIAIAVLSGLKLVYLSNSKSYKLIIITGLILQFIMLLFLARKSIILALGLASVIYLYYYFKNKKQKKYLFAILVVISIMFLLAPVTQKRFKEVFNIHSYSKIETTNSTSIRFAIYKCVIENIKEKPIFGHGIGDVKTELDKCYSKTSSILLKNKYNSHNQYLSVWLSNGIFGIIIFLIFLGSNFKRAFEQKNLLSISLLIFFCVVMLFENILERQSGVILFSLVINLFAFITMENSKNRINFDKLI